MIDKTETSPQYFSTEPVYTLMGRNWKIIFGIKLWGTETKNPGAGLLPGFAVRTGLEPATSCVTGRHSNQLN